MQPDMAAGMDFLERAALQEHRAGSIPIRGGKSRMLELEEKILRIQRERQGLRAYRRLQHGEEYRSGYQHYELSQALLGEERDRAIDALLEECIKQGLQPRASDSLSWRDIRRGQKVMAAQGLRRIDSDEHD